MFEYIIFFFSETEPEPAYLGLDDDQVFEEEKPKEQLPEPNEDGTVNQGLVVCF